jgi:pimeloyl-ACP methyl ester carboxylesterase
MPTFVLVHGAWHGGWCWSKVKHALEAASATVHTPTLTGLGERMHLASREICLETHIEDVVRLIDYELLTDVILVGHSYAGVVVTAVADRVSQRLSRLVYLDAVVPKNKQCLFDCASPEFRSQIEDQVRTQGEGWKIPVPSPAMLGLAEDEDIDWTCPRLVPHPYRTFTDAVVLRHSTIPVVPRSYVNCIGANAPGGPRTGQAEGIDDYHELSTGHDAMVTVPEKVSELLLRIAEASNNDASPSFQRTR